MTFKSRSARSSTLTRQFVLPAVMVSSLMGACDEKSVSHPADQAPRGRISLDQTGSSVDFVRTGRTSSTRVSDRHFLVYFEPDATAQQRASAESALNAAGSRKVGENTYSNMVEFSIPSLSSLNSLLDLAQASPGVFTALPDIEIRGQRDPNPDVSSSGGDYWVELVNAPSAWGISIGSPDVPLGIIDTAVDISRGYFARNTITRYAICHDETEGSYYSAINPTVSFPSNCEAFPNSFTDSLFHGTMVTVFSSASGDDGIPFVGMAWRNPVLSINDANRDGTIYTGQADAAIVTAINAGAKVINMSQADPRADLSAQFEMRTALRNAILYARAHDALVVFSIREDLGGGLGVSEDRIFPAEGGPSSYLAYQTNAIFVGATGENNCRVTSSNYGPLVGVFAPGRRLTTPTAEGGVSFSSGTSFAAPLVAGTAALMRSVNRSLTADQTRRIIISSANHSGHDCADGLNGLPVLDAGAAVAEAQRRLSATDLGEISWRQDFPFAQIQGIERLREGGLLIYGPSRRSRDGQLSLLLIHVSDYGDLLWEHELPVSGVTLTSSQRADLGVQQRPSGGFWAFGSVVRSEATPTSPQVRSDTFEIDVSAAGDLVVRRDLGSLNFDHVLSSDATGVLTQKYGYDADTFYRFDPNWHLLSSSVFDVRTIASSLLIPRLRARFGADVSRFDEHLGITTDGRSFFVSTFSFQPGTSNYFVASASFDQRILVPSDSTAQVRTTASQTPLTFSSLQLPLSASEVGFDRRMEALSDNSIIYSYQRDGNLKSIRVSQEGTILWNRTFATSRSAMYDHYFLNSDGTVLWQNFDWTNTTSVHFERLNADGTAAGVVRDISLGDTYFGVGTILTPAGIYVWGSRVVGTDYQSFVIKLDRNWNLR